ncbi:hypothetical protein AVEN_4380-1 [Araneus ventricosus]|uniref:Uncharacterized protein n=1 Tax=Araneus ventricosus TaxID=182803 RepID=A0A4Y2VSN9_ARAVE|nr:hypothetical protein AVEN_4380-1 [Araneus ventricosus]
MRTSLPENPNIQIIKYIDEAIAKLNSAILTEKTWSPDLNSLMVTTENFRLISLRRSPSAIKLERDGNKHTIQDIKELQTASQMKSEILIKKAGRSGL